MLRYLRQHVSGSPTPVNLSRPSSLRLHSGLFGFFF
ncbi:hypothetical protein CTAM01_16320 [Colletotrichum tamarilloi]|uniref:Uncharacterized protein n=1 Tax=Colletotrichum tamarilloi TaxID=1209934 RepID=A0ABQ9QIT8_9PEZI|nr:uncharacterized protein CTAM01_16320 [Colletotrichum tamarilloi]KAK1472655.1 hypothetical protein CTAM01_16320 [Colletotrichum tamarilloi]